MAKHTNPDGQVELMTDHALSMALLVNLAKRCRYARQELRRAQHRGDELEIGEARGAEREAWNSLQVAKEIAGLWSDLPIDAA